jgi:alpha-1,2-mannosyltransferase
MAGSVRSSAKPWIIVAKIAAATLMAVMTTWVYERIRNVYPVDLAVYRYGSAAAWRGVDLYAANLHGQHLAAEGLPFTYTPFAALVLWPTNLGNQQVGIWAWNIASMLALLAVLAMATPADVRHRAIAVFIAGAASTGTIMATAHFEFGQINLFLMLLVIADLCRRPPGKYSAIARWVPRGILIGIAAAIKLTPGLFIVYLAVVRQWRMFWWSVAGFLGAFVAAFAVRPSLTIAFLTHGLWRLSDKVALGSKFATSGNNSIQGVLAAVGGWTKPFALLLTALATVVGLLLARRAATRCGLLGGGVIVGLTATLISPISWEHHWVYLFPAAMFIWFRRGWWARLVVLGGAALTIFYTPEIGDRLITSPSSAHAAVGWLLREMLMLLAIIAIAVIAYGKPRPSRVRSGTEHAPVDQLLSEAAWEPGDRVRR